MRRRRLVNAAQNLALVLLTVSALFLVSRLPLLRGGLAQRVQALLAVREEAPAGQRTGNLGDFFPSVHLVVTGESEYGRYSRLYADRDDPLLRQCMPLFREALGSATEVGVTADRTLREALDTPSLYLDLTEELPLSAVAAWLGERAEGRNVRSLALCTESGESAVLYLRDQAGGIYRYYTALPSTAVLALCGLYSPNGGSFAYETANEGLAPYTVLSAGETAVADVQADLPAGCTAYNLLTALDFNAHTLSRYTESSGVEVVEESPRTLRISPDGAVSFISRGMTDLPLYRVSSAGESPTALEALWAAQALAQALTDGTGASPLYLRSVEAAAGGWVIRFCYQAEGIPVLFSDEEDALTVTVAGGAVTAFSYRCRSYTALDSATALLPPSMAAAIASYRYGGALALAYVDDGADRLAAQWLAGDTFS